MVLSLIMNKIKFRHLKKKKIVGGGWGINNHISEIKNNLSSVCWKKLGCTSSMKYNPGRILPTSAGNPSETLQNVKTN